DRVTDHRIKVSKSNLPGVLQGDIDDLISQLQMADRDARLGEDGALPAGG
ncbi:MAG: peptide chain release factor 1, partial [Pseudonocardiales bacterium]